MLLADWTKQKNSMNMTYDKDLFTSTIAIGLLQSVYNIEGLEPFTIWFWLPAYGA